MSDDAPKPEEADREPAEPEAAAPEAAASASKPDDEPKKKKKRKKDADETEAAPSDPRVVAVATAFDAGNFQRVRELAAELAKSDDAELSAVGRDYAARITVDPIQIAFLGLCAVALLTIAWIYVPH